MSNQAPFIAKFKTPENHYLYDVNSNHLLQVEQVIYDIIEDVHVLSDNELSEKYGTRYQPALLQKAKETINTLSNDDLLLSRYPEKLAPSYCEHTVADQLKDSMQQLILNVTENCNLRCKYCTFSGAYTYQRQHNKKRMTLDTAKKAVDYFLAHSVATDHRSIGFYGGEPLLEFDLIKKVVAYAQNITKGTIKFNMTTNGTLLDENHLEFLIKNNFFLLVSLDGPKEVHDTMRIYNDGRGSHDDILGYLKNFQHKWPDYYARNVAFSISLSHPHKLDEIYRYFTSDTILFSNQRFVINTIDSLDTSLFEDGNIQTVSYQEFNSLIQKMHDLTIRGKKLNTFLSALFEIPMVKIHKREMNPLGDIGPANGICVPGIRRLFCTTEGTYYPCEKVNPGLIIGDIHQGVDSKKVFNLMQSYADTSSEQCKTCFALRFCSACFSQLHRDQFDIEKKKLFCPGEQENLLRMMSLYCAIREKNPDALNYLDAITIS